jgi:Mg-chelatase subunit ChlD
MALFFKGVRGLNVPQLYNYIRDSAKENLIDAFVLAFNLRDARGGKGERDLGRKCLVWLFINYPVEFEAVLPLIAEYGRYDDLLQFFPGVLDLTKLQYVRDNYKSDIRNEAALARLQELQHSVVRLYAQRLHEDFKSMNDGGVVTLAAKWSPTENDSLDRSSNVFKTLAAEMKVSPRNLRKVFNTPLRAYLKVVEAFICSGQWGQVNYNQVPGHAMKKLRKAFEKHDPERFQAWREALKKNDPKVAKVCAKTLHPHEIVQSLRNGQDEVLEAQWRVLVEEVKKLGTLQDTVIVCDTSSSMIGLPMDISVALGMIISEVVQGPFHGHVITFNTTPQFVQIKDGSAYDRRQQVQNIPWGGSTNLQGTFELILRRGQECKLTDEDMPKRLIIVSDMQFNQIQSGGWGATSSYQTNFEAIDRMYKAAGYTRPQIVFWNVNGSSTDFPVTAGEHGTALVAGASPSTLKAIINGADFTPNGIMRQTLDDERYNPVREALTTE